MPKMGRERHGNRLLGLLHSDTGSGAGRVLTEGSCEHLASRFFLYSREFNSFFPSLGFECLSVALPAALLVQLQLSQHSAGLVRRVYQQSQYLDERRAQSCNVQKVIFRAGGCVIYSFSARWWFQALITTQICFQLLQMSSQRHPHEQMFKAGAGGKKVSPQLIISVCVVDLVCSICITGFKW